MFHVTWSLIIDLNCLCSEEPWNVMPVLIAFCASRWDTSISCQNQEAEFPHLKVPVWQLQGSDSLTLKYDAHLIRSCWINLCSDKQARPKLQLGERMNPKVKVILSITRKDRIYLRVNSPSVTISQFNVYMLICVCACDKNVQCFAPTEGESLCRYIHLEE